MPQGNGRGPMGMGPMTGRAAGYCVGADRPGNAKPVGGRGLRMGFGRGCGISGGRHLFNVTDLSGGVRYSDDSELLENPGVQQNPVPKLNRQDLQHQAEILRTQLDFITKQLDTVEVDTVEE